MIGATRPFQATTERVVILLLLAFLYCWLKTGAVNAATKPTVADSQPATSSRPTEQRRVFKLRVLDGDKGVAAAVSLRTGGSQRFLYVPEDGADVETELTDTTVTYASLGQLAEGEAAYEGRVTVKPEEESASLKLTKVSPIPVRIRVVDEQNPKGKAGAEVTLEHRLDGVVASDLSMKMGQDGSVESLLLGNGTYVLVFTYPDRRLPIRSRPFVPNKLTSKEYVFTIPPRNDLAFRVRFMAQENGKKVPAQDVQGVTILRERGGAMFPVKDGILYLDIGGGEALDEFRIGEKFRVQFHTAIVSNYDTPLESVVYSVGKPKDEPLEIMLGPSRRATVRFDIKSKDGKELPQAMICLQKKGDAGWMPVNGMKASITLGQYTCLAWQYGYNVSKRAYDIKDGDTISCVLTPATIIRIAAVDDSGKAIGGARPDNRDGVAGRLEYQNTAPLPEIGFLRFGREGVAELFYDAAYPGMAIIGGNRLPPVVVPLVASRTDYKVTIPKCEPVTVSLVAGDYKKVLSANNPLTIYWAVEKPFRKRVAKTIMAKDTAEVLLTSGVYVPFIELAGPNCPIEMMDKAIVFKKVTIEKGTKAITIEPEGIVPSREVLD